MVISQDRSVESALIPKDRYISKDWLAAEYQRLWPQVWQMACRLEEIPEVGDYYEYVIGDQSILVVRGEGEAVRAFPNACLHRGTQICAGAGNAGDELRCPYHGWAWNLDGSILEVPDADDFAPEWMSREALQLPEVHVGMWGGFVFVNMAQDPEPLLDFLAPVVAGLAPFEVDKMRLIRYRTTILPCNWKVGLSAFNEAYHVEATHSWDLSGYAHRLAEAGLGPSPKTRVDARSRGSASGLGTNGDRPDDRDMEGRTPGAYRFLYENFETHNSMRNAPTMVSAPLGQLGDPKQVAVRMLQFSQMIALSHQEDVDYVAAMPDAEVPGDMPAQQFLTDVRRKVGAAGGVDYSAIPDEDMLSAIDYCIYPNMVGPINAGNWILFRFRPNGDDPDSCVYDVMFLHRFGEGAEVPPLVHEFYPNWEDHDGWGPTIGQDLSNMKRVQTGLHQSSFQALRLNRQECGVRNHNAFIERYVSG